jgi:type IV conjugative transfer system lipoprotein TraV
MRNRRMKEGRILSNKVLGMDLRILCLSVGLLILNGCAVHKASFDCSDGQGMGCGSMIGVHESIKDNSFSKEKDSSKSTTLEPVCASCQKYKKTNNEIATGSISNTNLSSNLFMSDARNELDNKLIYRSQDKVMRVWFNSYFDENNNFHGEQYIYTVIEPAQWVINKRESL